MALFWERYLLFETVFTFSHSLPWHVSWRSSYLHSTDAPFAVTLFGFNQWRTTTWDNWRAGGRIRLACLFLQCFLSYHPPSLQGGNSPYNSFSLGSGIFFSFASPGQEWKCLPTLGNLEVLYHSLLLSVKLVVIYMLCPFASLFNFSICVSHVLSTRTLTCIVQAVTWQFKLHLCYDASILNMWSLRLLGEDSGHLRKVLRSVPYMHMLLSTSYWWEPSHMVPIYLRWGLLVDPKGGRKRRFGANTIICVTSGDVQ